MMRYKNLIAKVAIFSLVLGLVAVVGNVKAAGFTTMSDTMTRMGAGLTATHDILFTLPAGIDFDYEASTIDTLTFNFSNTFTTGGTWASIDFGFNDGTTRTVVAVDTTWNGTVTGCTDGANNVGVEISTASSDFRVIPCGASYTGSATGATINFEIYGAAPDGTLTNPSASNVDLVITMEDEGVASAHSGTIQMSIPDGDQVTINATVESTMTFDLNVGTSTTATSDAPYTVNLGTLSSGGVTTSNTSTVNMINIDLDANATGGVVVTVRNVNGANGLVSTSNASDAIEVATGDLVAGTEGYGICVNRVTAGTASTLQTSTNDFVSTQLSATAGATNSSTCTVSSHNVGGGFLSTTATTILSSNGAPLTGGWASVFVKATIANTTPAHDDYTDTLTFIATGTF